MHHKNLHEEDADVPESTELVESAVGEYERRGPEQSRVDVDDERSVLDVDEDVGAEQAEEAVSVEGTSHRLCRSTYQTPELVLPGHLDNTHGGIGPTSAIGLSASET